MIKPVSLTELFYFSCFDRLFYNAVAVFFLSYAFFGIVVDAKGGSYLKMFFFYKLFNTRE